MTFSIRGRPERAAIGGVNALLVRAIVSEYLANLKVVWGPPVEVKAAPTAKRRPLGSRLIAHLPGGELFGPVLSQVLILLQGDHQISPSFLNLFISLPLAALA